MFVLYHAVNKYFDPKFSSTPARLKPVAQFGFNEPKTHPDFQLVVVGVRRNVRVRMSTRNRDSEELPSEHVACSVKPTYKEE
jgi:hypothetical protein